MLAEGATGDGSEERQCVPNGGGAGGCTEADLNWEPAHRLEKGDEGRLRADRIFHPEERMGEEGGVRPLSFLTAPEVKVDFTFRP